MHRIFLFVVLAVVCGCQSGTSHQIASEKLYPSWDKKPFRKLLLIGFYEDRSYRVGAESVFAEELRQLGGSGTPSYDLIPNLKTLDSEAAVKRAIAGKGFDGILSVATLESNKEFDYDAHQTMYAFVRLLGSSGTFTRIGGAIDSHSSGYHVLDVGLWDARTLKPVWHGTTDSYSKDFSSGAAKEFAHFIVPTLRKKGLIR